MLNKRTAGERIFEVGNLILLAGLSLATLYPLLYVVFASFSDAAPLLAHKGLLLAPAGFNLQAYKLVLKDPLLVSSYMNTLIYVVGGTLISLTLTIMGAYGFSRQGTMLGTPLMFLV